MIKHHVLPCPIPELCHILTSFPAQRAGEWQHHSSEVWGRSVLSACINPWLHPIERGAQEAPGV